MRSALCGSWVRSSTGTMLPRSATLVAQLAACRTHQRHSSVVSDQFSAQEHAALDDLLAQVRRSPNIKPGNRRATEIRGAAPPSSAATGGSQAKPPRGTTAAALNSADGGSFAAQRTSALDERPSATLAAIAGAASPSSSPSSSTESPVANFPSAKTVTPTVQDEPVNPTTSAAASTRASHRSIPPVLRCGATAVISPIPAANSKKLTTPTVWGAAVPDWDVVLASAPYQSLLSRVRQAWTELDQERLDTGASTTVSASYSKKFLDLCIAPITEVVGYHPLTAHDIKKFLPDVDVAILETTILASTAASEGNREWFVWRQSGPSTLSTTTTTARSAAQPDGAPSSEGPHPTTVCDVVCWLDHSWEAFIQRGLEAIHLSWEPLDVVGRRLFSGAQLPLSTQDLARYLLKFSTSLGRSSEAAHQPLVELGILYRTAQRDVLTVLPLEREMLPSVGPSTTLVIRRARTVDAPPSVVEAVRLLGISTAVPPNRIRATPPPPNAHPAAARSTNAKSAAGGERSSGSDFVVLLKRLNDELTTLSADAAESTKANAPATTGANEENLQPNTSSSAMLAQAVQRLIPLEQALRVRLSEFSVPSRYLDSNPSSPTYQLKSDAAGGGVSGPAIAAHGTVTQSNGNATVTPKSSASSPSPPPSGQRESSAKRALHGSARRAHELRVAIVIAKQRIKGAASAAEERQHVAVFRQLRDELLKITGGGSSSATGGNTGSDAESHHHQQKSGKGASPNGSTSSPLRTVTAERTATAPPLPQRRPEGRFQRKAKA